MTTQEDKYPNSPRSIDFKSICLADRFGELKFERSFPLLEKLGNMIIELEELDYNIYLTPNETNKIENAKNTLIGSHVTAIKNFEIGIGDSKIARDNIENQIENFYNSTIEQLRPLLTFLRQEIKSENKTEKDLQTSLASAKKLENEYRLRLEKIAEGIEKDKKSIIKGLGVVSAQYLSKEFNEQSNTYEGQADSWFSRIIYSYVFLIIFTLLSFIFYYTSIRQDHDKSLLIEWGIFSFLLVSIIYYGLSFCSRNYDIQKNLAVSNRHRRNVAETFQNFLESDIQDEDAKSAFLKEASTAMFENCSSGYLSKDQMQISTPTQEMITKIISSKI